MENTENIVTPTPADSIPAENPCDSTEEPKAARGRNGKRVHTPASCQATVNSSDAEGEAVPAEGEQKPKKRQKKEKVEKEPKPSTADRRDAFKDKIDLTDELQYEDAETAKKGERSASFSHKGVIVITKKADEKTKACRVAEIWLHLSRIDVAISKKLFDSIETEALGAYRENFDLGRRGSKYVAVFNTDEEALEFVNLLTSTV